MFCVYVCIRSGLLIIWVAVETKPHPQGSESDLGLIPNGRVKLVWGAALDTMRYTICVLIRGVLLYCVPGRVPIPFQFRRSVSGSIPQTLITYSSELMRY